MNKPYEKNPDEIGVIWEKTARSGQKFMSGVLDLTETGKINIVIFRNKKEAGSKAPDYIILKSKELEKQAEKVEPLRADDGTEVPF